MGILSADDVIALERRLLDGAVRRSPDEVRALLHPEVREFGASGREWDRESLVAALAREPAEPGPVARADGFHAVLLGPDAILLTYRAHRPGRTTLRSSVWCRDGQGWRLLFHQGTVQPPGG